MITHLRARLDLSLAEFGTQLGQRADHAPASRQAVCDWESRRRPAPEWAHAAAMAWLLELMEPAPGERQLLIQVHLERSYRVSTWAHGRSYVEIPTGDTAGGNLAQLLRLSTVEGWRSSITADGRRWLIPTYVWDRLVVAGLGQVDGTLRPAQPSRPAG